MYEFILEDRHEINDVLLLGSICDTSVGVQESPDKISNKQVNKASRKDIRAGDGVFVLNQAELDNLKPNESESLSIKRYLDPNEIYKYGIAWREKYLIYSDKEVKDKIRTDNKYANIKKHLDKYIDFITSSNRPYGLHRPRDIRYFTTPKIIFKGMFVENEFTYDDQKYFTGFSFSLIIKKDPNYDLKYILAILNSKFALEWFYKNGKKRGAGGDIGVLKLRLFPIKKVSENDQHPFIEIVDKILTITKSEDYLKNTKKMEEVEKYEKQIDQMVYKLYGLTKEEIKIIESGK